MLTNITRILLSPRYFDRYENSPGLFRMYKEYTQRAGWTKERLEQYQISRLRRILIHARDNTEYYREVFRDCSFSPDKFEALEQLNALPILTKDIVRANFNRIISKDFVPEERYLSITGGTSDVTMRFYRNRECRSHRLAAQWRFDSWSGWYPLLNVAYIWPSFQDFHPDEGYKQKLVRKFITGVQPYYSGYLGPSECERIVKSLRDFKPRLIRCFPTPAVEIAQYMLANGTVLSGVKGVVSTGEPLYPKDRKALETAFNAPAYNLYASRETGPIAAQCERHGNLHIAVDSVAVEIVRNGRQLPHGESGEIVITDLRNFAMPLIRYAIKDLGQTTGEQCECGRGFPLMKGVIGREYDSFIDSNGRTVIALSLADLLIDKGPRVGQIQIIQNNPSDITVRLCGGPPLDESDRAFYSDGLKRLVHGTETVRFEIVDKIEREKSGKHRFSICRVDPEEIARLKRKAGAGS